MTTKIIIPTSLFVGRHEGPKGLYRIWFIRGGTRNQLEPLFLFIEEADLRKFAESARTIIVSGTEILDGGRIYICGEEHFSSIEGLVNVNDFTPATINISRAPWTICNGFFIFKFIRAKAGTEEPFYWLIHRVEVNKLAEGILGLIIGEWELTGTEGVYVVRPLSSIDPATITSILKAGGWGYTWDEGEGSMPEPLRRSRQ